MTTIADRIIEWAAQLPYWERATLDLLMRRVEIDSDQQQRLFALMLEDCQLTDLELHRPDIGYGRRQGATDRIAVPVKLRSLSSLRNINALAERQTLTFSPQLTAIYGGNGSGKSGYARVLGCAGVSRGDRDVLPNVMLHTPMEEARAATIEIDQGGAMRSIEYEIGEPCEDLSTICVFDSTSVRVHLTKSNRLSVSPAGLSVLTRLAEETDRIRLLLQQRIESRRSHHGLDAYYHGDTEIAVLIRQLGGETDLANLRRLSSVNEDERALIGSLDLEIARLKSRDIEAEGTSLRQTIKDLELLIQRLGEAEDVVSDSVLTSICELADRMRLEKERVEELSTRVFSATDLSHIGTEEWHEFASGAKKYAEVESVSKNPYPWEGSLCLLCHQPLSSQARELIAALWDHLDREFKANIESLNEQLRGMVSRVETLPLNFLSEDTAAFRYLRATDPNLLAEVSAFLAAAKLRQSHCRTMCEGGNPETIVALPPNPAKVLGTCLVAEQAKLRAISEEDIKGKIEELQRKKLILDHRVTLEQHMKHIENYVQQCKWIVKAEQVRGNTSHITRFYNKLFAELVTDRFIEVFQSIIAKMGRTLRVRLATQARKGEVFRQIVVETVGEDRSGTVSPENVLSEGEKRAVALADFLTEVALDTTNGTIVLDDPVTSLDLDWRSLIAGLLVQESASRQVVVFTHDLPFLYYLKDQAQRERVDASFHWVKRGESDDRPGYVFLDNSPAMERDYKSANRCREIYKEAKVAGAMRQEQLLREGFGALRTCYEAFIVFELFNEVVARFSERISVGRLMNVVVDQAIVSEVVKSFERLSRLIEGHLHSDALASQGPTPPMLLQEIEAFEALRTRLKNLKASKASQNSGNAQQN